MERRTRELLGFLDAVCPDATCELDYHGTDYGFLVSVMLSAQATDKSVNQVTAVLFDRYKTLQELADADEGDLIKIVRPLGLASTKGPRIKRIAEEILGRFDGHLPSGLEELMSLPGVGIKTANVVRAYVFKIPSIPVDTHVHRISMRLGYAAPGSSPREAEKALERHIPKDRQILAHYQLIWFGRHICHSRSPECEKCVLGAFCRENKAKS